MTDFEKLLKVLFEGGVQFIIIGGAAATAHGSARLTYDIDLVYSRSPENMNRLAEALTPYSPYLRGAPEGLPFVWDAITLAKGLNLTLTTTLGFIDLFGEVTGGGGYDALISHTITIKLFGISCRCLSLEKLIEVKRAAGRPKDLEVIAELETLRDEGAALFSQDDENK
jgi:predicted nucleotidyltransferase